MKKLFGLCLFLFSLTVFSAPFVIGDVSAEADKCVWGGTGFGPLVNDVVVDNVNGNASFGFRVCKRDVVGALIGTNNITLAVRDNEGVWGDSETVPFSFVRPDLKPSGIRLVP